MSASLAKCVSLIVTIYVSGSKTFSSREPLS
jgi:hypothetical protein